MPEMATSIGGKNMALGSSIDYSVPAIGTTVNSVAIIKDGEFSDGDYFTDTNGNDVPLMVKFRPGVPGSNSGALGLTATFNPAVYNQALDTDQGKVSVTINAHYRQGVSVDAAEVEKIIHYAISCLLKATAISGLISGSVK
jgi:hypothetical protein